MKNLKKLLLSGMIIGNIFTATMASAESYHLSITEDEIDLIALVTMAEAEGEDEYGKRLVIDTILNRVNSEHFPDTVEEVIYQPYQFESMWNGRADICYVDENICELVRGEVEELTDAYTFFFCSGGYSKYGIPMYQVGNHYFSTYE